MSDFDTKVKQVEADLEASLKTNALKVETRVVFPQYAILPDEVKLALLILDKHGAQIVREYQPQESEAQDDNA